MESFDRGSALLAEVEFKAHVPFGTEEAFDPTAPTVTVTDPAGTVVINAEAMISNVTVGEWYYVIQTLEAWVKGKYNVKVLASDGTYNDITISKSSFKLI